MTKKIKTVLLLCLTLCAAVFALAFSACDDGGETFTGTYTVTVQYEDGSPVTDCDVQFCVINENGTQGTCLTPITVDSNGVAEIAIAENTTYHIQINNLPDGYTYDQEIYTENGVYSCTVVVTPEN